ncbi:MAG: hypothetical protein L0L22_06590 [Staphylococcus equorum]|nr:hypothetical protein [Staphylococcus equorum]
MIYWKSKKENLVKPKTPNENSFSVSNIQQLRIRDETIFPTAQLTLKDDAMCNNIPTSSFSCLSNPADRMTISVRY